MVLAKITIKLAHSRGVRGVAAYRGSVCAMYTVRVFPCSEVFAVETCRSSKSVLMKMFLN